VSPKPSLSFLGNFDQYGFDPNLDRVLVPVEIATAMEVMLVDDGPAEQPLWTEHKVECFAHGRFTDIVAANQQSMRCEIDHAFGNTSKVRNFEPPNAHEALTGPAICWRVSSSPTEQTFSGASLSEELKTFPLARERPTMPRSPHRAPNSATLYSASKPRPSSFSLADLQ
jgi:hypothetical protein